jgi:hypothetical protein
MLVPGVQPQYCPPKNKLIKNEVLARASTQRNLENVLNERNQ